MEHTRRRFKVFIFLLTLASCAQGQLYCYVCDDCENTNGEILQYCGPKETSTVLPEDTITTVPPEATTTVSTAATTTVPPEATTTSVPPEATTTATTAATTTVPPEATTTSVPPEASTTVPPEATTTVPTAATTTVPPEATTSVPPEATTSVPPEATTSVPPEATTTVPTETTTALSSEATPTTKEATTISEDQTATSSGDGITITLSKEDDTTSNQLEETRTITEIAEVSLNTLLDEIPTFGDFSISRRRRDTSGTVYACYSIALKGGGTAKRQVNRGCLAMPLGQNGCGFLKQENNLNASQVENCLVCQNDGCNGSAIAKLSGLALLAALVLRLLQ